MIVEHLTKADMRSETVSDMKSGTTAGLSAKDVSRSSRHRPRTVNDTDVRTYRTRILCGEQGKKTPLLNLAFSEILRGETAYPEKLAYAVFEFHFGSRKVLIR